MHGFQPPHKGSSHRGGRGLATRNSPRPRFTLLVGHHRRRLFSGDKAAADNKGPEFPINSQRYSHNDESTILTRVPFVIDTFLPKKKYIRQSFWGCKKALAASLISDKHRAYLKRR